MTAAVLSIGTELVRGELLEQQRRVAFGGADGFLGFEVVENISVADDKPRILGVLDFGSLAAAAFSSAPAASGPRPTT